jgi:hypothetical protein
MLQRLEAMHDELPDHSFLREILFVDICILDDAVKELKSGTIEDTSDLEDYIEKEYEKFKD